MTKSKGLGRGGVRKGAGRPPKVLKVDWDAIARDYFTGLQSIDAVLAKHDLKHGDLLAYAATKHWMARPRVRGHEHDLGDLASALALEFFGEQDAAKRSRRFVAAMVALDAAPASIAEILQTSESELRRDYAKEIAGARR
ncbi:hypothetical protein V1281_001774 [Nitrobacteraceae bacterium AZCC 2161]